MSSELQTRELTTPAQSAMSIIAQASADPNCDVGKMQALIAMQKDLIAIQARSEYNAAMVACQSAMGPVVRNCLNRETNQKFVNLEAIDFAIKPLYQRYGFGITVHNPAIIDGNMVVTASVLHKGGHVEEYSVQFANDSKGPKGGAVKTEIQGAVSTISYATRVLKCKIFDITIVGADKDGQTRKGITLEQERTIIDLLNELGMSQTDDNFLAWAGADSITHIHPGKFQQLVAGLKKRIEDAKS
jgi:hypothetical protein